MKTVSITELKAKLSQWIDTVREGEEVLVTNRGRPVARIQPIEGWEDFDARTQWLIRTGRAKPPERRGRLDLDRELPKDPEGLSIQFLIEERRSGR